MKNLFILFVTVGLGACLWISPAAVAQPAPTVPPAPEPTETEYAAAVEKRTTDILVLLELKDEAKTKQVHDTIVAQYRALRDWQTANEAKLKPLTKPTDAEARDKIMATRATLHTQFIAKLSADLTPAQLEKVKDKMTYGKLKVTYDAYCQFLPDLTDEEKAKVKELLTAAREEAMDGVNSHEKDIIFKKYKGKVNTYLATHGRDVGKATKEWGAKQPWSSAAKSNAAAHAESAVSTNPPAK